MFTWNHLIVNMFADKLLVSEDPALYSNINQGCLTVDNMDDKEEMRLADVCTNLKRHILLCTSTLCSTFGIASVNSLEIITLKNLTFPGATKILNVITQIYDSFTRNMSY